MRCAFHRQPRRPVRRRPQSVVPPGGVRQPVLHELPGGVLESCVRQALTPGPDVGVAQYQRDLPRRAHMRVHDPVDERQGPGVGRKNLEEAGGVGTVGHVGAHSVDRRAMVAQIGPPSTVIRRSDSRGGGRTRRGTRGLCCKLDGGAGGQAGKRVRLMILRRPDGPAPQQTIWWAVQGSNLGPAD